MKKLILSAVCLILVLMMAVSASATVGRDILMVHRATNNWTRDDVVTVILADGSRLVFDLGGVPYEARNDLSELLFFLRTHGLSDSTMLYAAKAPQALNAISKEQAENMRLLLGTVQIQPIELRPHKMDAGDFLTYAVLPVDFEASLVLLTQSGNHQGSTTDPAALELIKLAGPYLMGE